MTGTTKHPPVPISCQTYSHMEIANDTQGLVICISTEHKWNFKNNQARMTNTVNG